MRPTNILRNMGCGCCITIVEGGTFPLVWSNPEFERITGYNTDELQGRDPWFLHTGLCPEAEAQMKATVALRKSCRGVIQIRTAQGEKRWVEVTGRPSTDNGDPRLFGMIDDWGDDWQARFARLTPPQERFFSVLVNGVSIQAAGRLLGLAQRTAYRYTEQIMRKLEIDAMTELYLLQRH